MKTILELMEKLSKAEELHPIFAEGVYQGLGVITEEYLELVDAINHNRLDEVQRRAEDLFVVTYRFIRGDYNV